MTLQTVRVINAFYWQLEAENGQRGNQSTTTTDAITGTGSIRLA